MTISQDTTLPRIHLLLPLHRAPPRLHKGLRHIAAGAIREDIKVGDDGILIGASGTLVDGSPLWWWNVEFQQDSSISPGQFAVTPASPSFVGSQGTVDAPIEEPFSVIIRYARPCEAFRGLGHVLAIAVSSLHPLEAQPAAHPGLTDASSRWTLDPLEASRRLQRQEQANFETLGTMVDCSRNGVMQVQSVKFLCRALALMGYNMLQLYTEDTYQIADEPFFGYLRGAYTYDELREIDDYAFELGIEVIPCIQTLGHLGQVLQWPQFLSLRDTNEVLLAEWPETYIILEKMISAATAPFRSKRIHIGMDETHGLGHGRYHAVFGRQNYKDPTRIFVEHLQRVNQICKRQHLEPMIWSDMLFCLSAQNNSLFGYYDSAQPAQVDGIPSDVGLVYWDYYHTSSSAYTQRIANHVELSGQQPWMAAGSWTWSRFWTALPFTFTTCKASMNASKASNVRHVFLTIWGDEANEVDLWSSLPAWGYYAEHGYTREEEVDPALLRAKFDGIVAGNFDDFVAASSIDTTAEAPTTVDDRIQFAPNTSKWLLWEDPSLSFVSPTLGATGLDLGPKYTALAKHLGARLSVDSPLQSPHSLSPPRSLADYPFNARLRFPYLLAKILALKASLRDELHAAYLSHNWPVLASLGARGQNSRLGCLRAETTKLWQYHRQMWMSMYKPFGWETIELRYGGLQARLDTLHSRVARFLDHLQAGGEVGIRRTISGTDASLRRFNVAADRAASRGIMLSPAGAETSEYEDQVVDLPELAVPLQVVYGSADQLLEYHRVSRPTYC